MVLLKNGRFLLMRRSATAGQYPLMWGFPGGHIEEGETPIQGAAREVQEETNIELRPAHLRFVMKLDEDGLPIHVFRAHAPQRAQPRLLDGEHDRYAWITPKEIECYPVLPLVKEAIDNV